MGAKSSSPAAQQSISFEKLPSEVKLYVFTLLPYQDLTSCMLLNNANYNLIVSNLRKMKKIQISTFVLKFDLWYSRMRDINLKIPQCMMKDDLFHSGNSVCILEDRCYLINKSSNLAVFYKQQECVKREFPTLNRLKFWKHSSELERVARYSFPITSIQDGVQRHLGHLLAKINPCVIIIMNNPMASYCVANLIPPLIEKVRMYGTQTSEVHLYEMQINSDVVELINSFDCRLTLNDCTFENNTLFSQLSRFNVLCICGMYDSPIHHYETYMFNLFFENWKNGAYPNFSLLTWYLIYGDKIEDYYDMLQNIFECRPNWRNGYSLHNMQYIRFDGWMLSFSQELCDNGPVTFHIRCTLPDGNDPRRIHPDYTDFRHIDL